MPDVFLRVRGPLRLKRLWVWLFPSDWRISWRRPPQSVQIGPLFIDWFKPIRRGLMF